MISFDNRQVNELNNKLNFLGLSNNNKGDNNINYLKSPKNNTTITLIDDTSKLTKKTKSRNVKNFPMKNVGSSKNTKDSLFSSNLMFSSKTKETKESIYKTENNCVKIKSNVNSNKKAFNKNPENNLAVPKFQLNSNNCKEATSNKKPKPNKKGSKTIFQTLVNKTLKTLKI